MIKIIKLGGSLLETHHLKACLNHIAHYEKAFTVIVPGGGLFAEQVRIAQRQWHFNDTAAHEMAILAMQQMALLFNALQPQWKLIKRTDAFFDGLKEKQIMIWSPDIVELNAASITATWQITSDSLSAWLANQLKADELVLIKAVDSVSQSTISELILDGIVDTAFESFIVNKEMKLTVTGIKTFLGFV